MRPLHLVETSRVSVWEHPNIAPGSLTLRRHALPLALMLLLLALPAVQSATAAGLAVSTGQAPRPVSRDLMSLADEPGS